jgi:AefR-like transcriptional repressor, C-terminal domain
VLSRMRLGVEMIERSVEALPDLARVFGDVRGELFARYERYLRQGMEAGRFRVADPEAVTHVIVDVCWWAPGRRLSDPHATAISESTARQTVRRFVADALTGGADRQVPNTSEASPIE